MTDFHQTDSTRRVLTDAMRGAETFTKSLTEITLNSHESYRRLQKANGGNPLENSVLIRADSRGEYFEVIDHFEGIAADENTGIKILSIKAKKQDSHTADSRSAMGRGMSDVLFRKLNVPSIIAWRKDGKTFAYQCVYEPDIKDKDEYVRSFKDQRTINPQLIERIEKLIPENGTYVKFSWAESDEQEPFPTKVEIKEHLGYYYELKNILSQNDFIFNLDYIEKDGTVEHDQINFVNYVTDEVAVLGKTDLNITLDPEFAKRCKCWHKESEHVSSGCNQCKNCTGFNNTYEISILSAKLYRSKSRLITEGERQTQGIYFEGEHGQVYCMEPLFDLNQRYVDSPFYYAIVVFSSDAKNYMMNMNTAQIGVEILSSTRTGFDKTKKNRLYHKSKAILRPWIEEYLKAQSKIVVENEDSLSEEGKNEFNKMMSEIMDIEEGIGDGGGPDEGPIPEEKVVDLLEFRSKSYRIIKHKKSKVYLLFNPDKFSVGTKIEWLSTNTSVKIFPTVTEIPKGGNKIPLVIQSDSAGDETSIIATIKTKDNADAVAQTLVECIEEKDVKTVLPEDYLEFFPKTTKVKIFSKNSIDLYAHPNVIPSGTKIEVKFEPDDGYALTESIKITSPIEVKMSAPNYVINFNQSDSECIEGSRDYRRTTITFEGIQPGLKGKLIAKTILGDDEHIATCMVSFDDDVDSGDGGFLKDWVVKRLRGGHKAFEYQDGKCIANPEVSHVKSILSDNDDVAKKRYKLYEETKMFVISEMMKLGFEVAMQKLYSDKHTSLQKEGLEDVQIFSRVLDEMKDWEALYADKMMNAFGVKPRISVPDEIYPHNLSVQIGSRAHQKYEINAYALGERETFGNEKFSEPELQKPLKKSMFNFCFKDTNMKIGIYHFDDGIIAVRLDAFDFNTKIERVLRQLRDGVHIYRKPEKNVEGIPEKWIYASVDVNLWQKNNLDKVSIRKSNVLKIPDSPDPLGNTIPVEDDPTWVFEGEPLVRYSLFENVKTLDPNNKKNGQLVSFVNPENLHIIALNYFRHKIMRPIAIFDYISKIFEQTGKRKCSKCGLEASSWKTVEDSFDYFLDDDNPGISEICKGCERI